MLESDKHKYCTPVYGLNVAHLITIYFSDIWLINLSADVVMVKMQTIIFCNAAHTVSHESKC